jgi:hypothetical protein
MPGLVYIGQGRIRARIRAHAHRALAATDSQSAALGAVAGLEVSWTTVPWTATPQLLQLENDLIAAHIRELGSAPTAQYRG